MNESKKFFQRKRIFFSLPTFLYADDKFSKGNGRNAKMSRIVGYFA